MTPERRTAAATSPIDVRPWWREPLVWLVGGLPALTVVAGLTTVAIAMHHADGVVRDDYRKEGLAINRDPSRDDAAARLGVAATVRADEGALAVRLRPGAAEPPKRLVVILSHATLAEHDRMVTLAHAGGGVYSTEQAGLPRGHWYVEISPADRAWRLTGDFVDRTAALELRPPAARVAAR
jgi:hypothetical protein